MIVENMGETFCYFCPFAFRFVSIFLMIVVVVVFLRCGRGL